MSYTLTQTELGAGNIQLDVLWSVNAQQYKLQSNLQFTQLLRTIFDVADYLAGGGGLTNPLVLPDNTNANGYSLNTLDNGAVGGSINVSGGGGGAGGTGGSINLSGGDDGGLNFGAGGAGGSINLSGGDDDGNDGANGGSISLAGGTDLCIGGSIISNGGIGTFASGGTLNMSGGVDCNGGSINTSGGNLAATNGGSIDTSEGGGSINTRGVGSIQFGVIGTRTTLNGSATADQTITLPDLAGTLLVGSISATAGAVAVGEYLTIVISGVTRKLTLLQP